MTNNPYPTEERIQECQVKFDLERLPAIRLIRRHHGRIPEYADSADKYAPRAEKHKPTQQQGIFDD
jgi:hypothetical protein